VHRTAYRPDPWKLPEWIVAGGGVLCAVVMLVSVGYSVTDLDPSLYPLSWPTLPPVPALAIVVAGLAALAAPPPVRARRAPTKSAGAPPAESKREKVPA
jgi:energy-coupling factor transport system permease protein